MLTARPFHALTVLAALLAAPAAQAGDKPIETSVGKIFTLKFDLGFKLGCKHDYTVEFDPPGLIELVNAPEQTSSTNFKARALAVGTVMASATFTGPGGNCMGTADDTTDVNISPDAKYTEKAWKTAVKDADKGYRSVLKTIGGDLDDAIDDIVADFKDEEIDSLEAAQEIFDAVRDAQGDAALAGFLGLVDLSSTGTELLSDGGLTSPPLSFQSGTPGSLWTGASYDTAEDYEEFAEDNYKSVTKALDQIQKGRVTFSYATYVNGWFPFDPPAGPGSADDPDDVFSAPATIMGGFAINDGGVGAMRFFGTGLLSRGDVAVDVSGPTGFTPLNLELEQTELDVGAAFGSWTLQADALSLSGRYMLQSRYATESNDDQKISISLQF